MITTKVIKQAHIWSILFYLSGVTGEILAAVASGDSDANSIGMESWFGKNIKFICYSSYLSANCEPHYISSNISFWKYKKNF
jgi:hypothetical protein